MAQPPLVIASWNVNGLRACGPKGFNAWLDTCGADIVLLQETRATAAQLPESLRAPPGWHVAFSSAQRLGYSGVAALARKPWDHCDNALAEERFDCEGRVQFLQFGELTVVGAYFPNGNGKDRDNSRIPYKLDFYRAVQARVQPLCDAGKPVVVLGDWNTATEAIDLARPKDNEQTSGFRPEERAEVRHWLANGWTDTYRHFYPAQTGAYTWWSQRFGVRAKNIGWRIDLALCSRGALPFLQQAAIFPEVMSSDHCPIAVTLAGGVTGR